MGEIFDILSIVCINVTEIYTVYLDDLCLILVVLKKCNVFGSSITLEWKVLILNFVMYNFIYQNILSNWKIYVGVISSKIVSGYGTEVSNPSSKASSASIPQIPWSEGEILQFFNLKSFTFSNHIISASIPLPTS